MPLAPPARLHASALAVLLALGAPLGAQQAPLPGMGAPRPGAGAPLENPPANLGEARPMAMVNGVAITLSEVQQTIQVFRQRYADAPSDQLLRLARQSLAEEIVLAAEAERLGVELSDEQVTEYWKAAAGGTIDFAALAASAGTSVERQRDLARRAAMSQIYLTHKVGYRSEYAARIPVDPIMARMLSVTPRQLREYYQQEKDSLFAPATVSFDAFLAKDQAQAWRIRDELLAGRTPTEGELAPNTLPVSSLNDLLPPRLTAWLQYARSGDVSEILPAGEGDWMLARFKERREARTATFAEVQDDLRAAIQAELLLRARKALVVKLVQGAVFWPEDLFDFSTPPPQVRAGRVASPPAGP